MAEHVNPLLFSASSSVFDSITTSAVILPPQNNGAEISSSGDSSARNSMLSTVSTSTAASQQLANSADHKTECPATSTTHSDNNFYDKISFPSNIPSIPVPEVLPSATNSRTVAQSTSIFYPPSVSPLIPSQAGSTMSQPNLKPSVPLQQSSVEQFNVTTGTNSAFTPTITPSISPIITPSITPTMTPRVTPLPPVLLASNMGGAGANIPPPPIGATIPSQCPAPPPLLATGLPPFMPAPATNSTQFKPFVPATTIGSSASEAKVSAFTPLKNLPDTNWAPPIYGVTPEKEPTIVPPSFEDMSGESSIPTTMASYGPAQIRYRPVIPHWFYAVPGRPVVWRPFSFTDSINLEEAHMQGGCGLVCTDGGRYDVEVSSRVRRPVYWGAGGDTSAEAVAGTSNVVRRCSWFRKGALDIHPQPYEEEVAELLEEAFRSCMESGSWQQQVEVSGEWPGLVVLSSPHSMHHYSTTASTAFPTSVSIAESQAPDSVKRGADDFTVNDGEADQVDHLLFLVHGIGPVCDLSFRSVEECVDTFREIGADLLSTHFRQSVDCGRVGRVEVLPVSWHRALHSEADGIDARLRPITLRSIPMLREFTNDTILDVLLYTSPAYCQLIIDTVSSELNRLYSLFCHRNPTFKGGVSVAGHSLGSVILFDLLMHQKPVPSPEKPDVAVLAEEVAGTATEGDKNELEAGVEVLEKRGVGMVLTASAIRARRSQADLQSSRTSSVNFEIGTAGTGQPSIVYPQLCFQPAAVFLLGSPIAMFLTVRGLTQLSSQYRLPTCPHVFNIFHPYDPVAYRLETLIHPHLTDLRPLLVPHHKGRKRMHLELKDTLERVGSDIKHRIVDSIQATWNKLYYLYAGGPTEQQHQEMEKAVEEQLGRLNLEVGSSGIEAGGYEEAVAAVGQLNDGRRIDYVLQEKPYESFTEYIFALQAHLSYWKSEDTLLLMLKEIYGSMGVMCDTVLAQSTTAATTASDIGSLTSASLVQLPVISSSSPSAPPPAIPMLPSQLAAETPVPVLSPTVSAPTNSGGVRVLGGRPLIDLSLVQQPVGMDPTAEPHRTGAAVPPPPTGMKVSFNIRKKPSRR